MKHGSVIKRFAPTGRLFSTASRRKLAPYLFIAPFVITYLTFWVWPIFFAVFLSLNKWAGGASHLRFVGLRNYLYLFEDEIFHAAVSNTFYYCGGVIMVMLPLALALALLLNTTAVRLKGFFRLVVFSPIVMSTVVVSMIFLLLLDPRSGLLVYLFSWVGLKFPAVLSSRTLAMPTIIGLGVWRATGVFMLFFLAGLQGISPELYEAAQIDGANKLQSFFYVTIPQLRNTAIFTISIALINSIRVFAEPYLLTQGGPGNATLTLSLQLYRESFRYCRFGYGATVSVVLLAIIMTITLLFLKFSGAFQREEKR